MEKILVAMSGGVDSSVTASLLCESGARCVGATMRLHGYRGSCGTASDAEDAAQTARGLGMEHLLYDFTEDFERCVISPFVSAYEKAQTPNPCILCNKTMKFDKLFEAAREQGCDFIATGHYARAELTPEGWRLKRAKCREKDQTYVLYFLSEEQLSRIRFPLGDFESKADVRAYAAAHGFINATKPDSEDICFVPDGDYAGFLRGYTGRDYPEGDYIDEDGNVLGRHKGMIHYTVGQRKGLGIACGRRMFVRELRPEDNAVVLTPDPKVECRSLIAREFVFTGGAPASPIEAAAVVRYLGKEYPATVTPMDGGRVRIDFHLPARAAYPGQAVVLYDADTVLGGGVIEMVI